MTDIGSQSLPDIELSLLFDKEFNWNSHDISEVRRGQSESGLDPPDQRLSQALFFHVPRFVIPSGFCIHLYACASLIPSPLRKFEVGAVFKGLQVSKTWFPLQVLSSRLSITSNIYLQQLIHYFQPSQVAPVVKNLHNAEDVRDAGSIPG